MSATELAAIAVSLGLPMGADFDSILARVEELTKERDAWKKDYERTSEELTALHDKDAGSVWYWQDDKDDDPESLACPVLMAPERLRKFVAAEARCSEMEGVLREARLCASSCEGFCEDDGDERGANECKGLIARIDSLLTPAERKEP